MTHSSSRGGCWSCRRREPRPSAAATSGPEPRTGRSSFPTCRRLARRGSGRLGECRDGNRENEERDESLERYHGINPVSNHWRIAATSRNTNQSAKSTMLTASSVGRLTGGLTTSGVLLAASAGADGGAGVRAAFDLRLAIGKGSVIGGSPGASLLPAIGLIVTVRSGPKRRPARCSIGSRSQPSALRRRAGRRE